MTIALKAAFAVLVVDSDRDTAAILAQRITARGHQAIACSADAAMIRAAIEGKRFDAVVLDYHFERPTELQACELVKSLDSSLPVLALTSPGFAMRNLEAWNRDRRCVDHVIRKPLVGEAFFKALEALAGERRADARAGRYAGLIAEEAMQWADSTREAPALSEHAILFTDIRRSTQLVSTLPLPQWFASINHGLTEQGAIVRHCGGSVVKYTGDGLLASFRGRGRSHLALRCALMLQEPDQVARYRDAMRLGVGLAEGLVMSGLIGEPGRRQFDVIGATVHLAARLCSIANEGEIVATPRLVRAAGMAGPMPAATRTVHLRGFSAPVDCVSFAQVPHENTSPHGDPHENAI